MAVMQLSLARWCAAAAALFDPEASAAANVAEVLREEPVDIPGGQVQKRLAEAEATATTLRQQNRLLAKLLEEQPPPPPAVDAAGMTPAVAAEMKSLRAELRLLEAELGVDARKRSSPLQSGVAQ